MAILHELQIYINLFSMEHTNKNCPKVILLSLFLPGLFDTFDHCTASDRCLARILVDISKTQAAWDVNQLIRNKTSGWSYPFSTFSRKPYLGFYVLQWHRVMFQDQECGDGTSGTQPVAACCQLLKFWLRTSVVVLAAEMLRNVTWTKNDAQKPWTFFGYFLGLTRLSGHFKKRGLESIHPTYEKNGGKSFPRRRLSWSRKCIRRQSIHHLKSWVSIWFQYSFNMVSCGFHVTRRKRIPGFVECDFLFQVFLYFFQVP